MQKPLCKRCSEPVDDVTRKHCIYCIVTWKRRNQIWSQLRKHEFAVMNKEKVNSLVMDILKNMNKTLTK